MPESNTDTEPTKDGSNSEKSSTRSSESVSLLQAKQMALDAAGELLEHPVESVIKLNKTSEQNFRVVIEVVERQAVPDTQDLIGRYEFTVESSGDIAGYSLVERYNRGDAKDEL